MTAVLPDTIAPMLARAGAPFDSKEHLFEPKWDGVRALCFVDDDGHRLHGRRRRDLRERYPELAFLADLPRGLVLDGELVVLDAAGRPDFRAMLARENGTARAANNAARSRPVVYIAFDLLYEAHESLLLLPLRHRRERLAQVVAAAASPRLSLSEAVVEHGNALFAAVCQRGLEGMVAKRLDSPYRPGERTADWQKIKPVHVVHCVVLGFEPKGRDDFASLIVATDLGAGLECVGKVGSGLREADRRELRPWLFGRQTPRPLIAVDLDGVWVEPGLYCKVSFLERTSSGALRAPVFLGLVPA